MTTIVARTVHGKETCKVDNWSPILLTLRMPNNANEARWHVGCEFVVNMKPVQGSASVEMRYSVEELSLQGNERVVVGKLRSINNPTEWEKREPASMFGRSRIEHAIHTLARS